MVIPKRNTCRPQKFHGNKSKLAPEKIAMKRELLSDYQLKIADPYNIHIGNVKKSVPNGFDK